MYRSDDTESWNFQSILFQEKTISGRTLECPGLFYLDGNYVLILSIFETKDNKDFNYQSFFILVILMVSTLVLKHQLDILTLHKSFMLIKLLRLMVIDMQLVG